MATIINNPSDSTREVREVRDDGSGAGVLIGILFVVLVVLLLLAFGIPYLRNNSNSTRTAPAGYTTSQTTGTSNGVSGSLNGSGSVSGSVNGGGSTGQ